jgi:hypothetical protein
MRRVDRDGAALRYAVNEEGAVARATPRAFYLRREVPQSIVTGCLGSTDPRPVIDDTPQSARDAFPRRLLRWELAFSPVHQAALRRLDT